MRRQPCSHTFLAFILKFLNFLQFFIGLSMIMYGAYMLNHWYNNDDDQPPYPPPSAPSPSAPLSDYGLDAIYLSAFNHGFGFLPAPWFIFAFMGMGIVLCCVTCIGHIAAEAINGCCLGFYTLLSTVLISIEAAFVAFIVLDHHWENDLPYDPTGEVDHLCNFIEKNIEICIWVGISVLIVQALSLLISLLLQAVISAKNSDDDMEADYEYSSREPLLNPQQSQASALIKVDGHSPKVETWSSRMRKKYGLSSSSSSNNKLL